VLISYNNNEFKENKMEENGLEEQLTDDIDEREEFAEEISVSPEVVVLQVRVEVVQQQFLLLTFLHLGDDPQVQVHDQGRDLAGLPILPKPTRNVEQNCLKKNPF
jgi:hypothetical protein